jgi:fluoride exporter
MSSPTFLSHSLNVALGGAVGAWLRFVTGGLVLRLIGPVAAAAFPWATLLINVVGSFFMGVLAGWLARYGGAGGEGTRLLLGVGLLGGFTTFSAFSLEIANMAERGVASLAVIYALVSVFAGVAGLFAGLALMRVTA